MRDFFKNLKEYILIYLDIFGNPVNKKVCNHIRSVFEYEMIDVCYEQTYWRNALPEELDICYRGVMWETKFIDEPNHTVNNGRTYYGYAEFKISDESRYVIKFWDANKYYSWCSETELYYIPSIHRDEKYIIDKWKGGLTKKLKCNFYKKIQSCRKRKQLISMDNDTGSENWLKSFAEKC